MGYCLAPICFPGYVRRPGNRVIRERHDTLRDHPSSFILLFAPSCEFLLCSKDSTHGLHGDKGFVFAHVFLQEVTEGTENLCQISFLLFKNIVSNISVHSVDSSEAGGGLILQCRCMNGDFRDILSVPQAPAPCLTRPFRAHYPAGGGDPWALPMATLMPPFQGWRISAGTPQNRNRVVNCPYSKMVKRRYATPS
jgi:hypothetical protein